MRIFCDFDGTISQIDTTDLILNQFADPAWERIEAQWVAGEINAATCMAAQIALIRAPIAAIDEALDQVELRDGFLSFLRWARREEIAISIVSDGVDHFIRRVLARHGVADVPIIANRLVRAAKGRWRLDQPWRNMQCSGGSGVCKCTIVGAEPRDVPLVFVGDGRSDFCVANKPDILFATAGLERFCLDNGFAHRPFTTFGEIQSVLRAMTPAAARAA